MNKSLKTQIDKFLGQMSDQFMQRLHCCIGFFIKDHPRLILIITTNHATSYQCFLEIILANGHCIGMMLGVGGDWHLKYGWLNIVIAIVSHQIALLDVLCQLVDQVITYAAIFVGI